MPGISGGGAGGLFALENFFSILLKKKKWKVKEWDISVFNKQGTCMISHDKRDNSWDMFFFTAVNQIYRYTVFKLHNSLDIFNLKSIPYSLSFSFIFRRRSYVFYTKCVPCT